MKTTKLSKPSRVPRPLGLTLLANQIQKTRNKNIIPEQYIESILNYILSNQLQLNNKPLSLQTLAQWLGIPFQTVMKAFLKMNEKAAAVMLPGGGRQQAGALIFFSLQKILESQSEISNQREILKRSQGDRHKAFVTGDLNNVLRMEQDGTKYLLDIAKALSGLNGPTGQFGTNNPMVQMGSNGPNTNTSIKSIGVNEALQILQDEGLTDLTFNPHDYEGISKQHQISAMPEVRANLQIGNMDDAKYMEAKDNKVHHRTRRVRDERLDSEEII